MSLFSSGVKNNPGRTNRVPVEVMCGNPSLWILNTRVSLLPAELWTWLELTEATVTLILECLVFKSVPSGAGEMAPQFRACAALADNQTSVPSTHRQLVTAYSSSAMGSHPILLPSKGTKPMCTNPHSYTHSYTVITLCLLVQHLYVQQTIDCHYSKYFASVLNICNLLSLLFSPETI